MYGCIGFHVTSKAEAIVRAKILLQTRPTEHKGQRHRKREEEGNVNSEQAGNFMAENKSLHSVCDIHLIEL